MIDSSEIIRELANAVWQVFAMLASRLSFVCIFCSPRLKTGK